MSAVVESTVRARDLKTGQVIVAAGQVFVVELVARHITIDDQLHVVTRTVKGGVMIFERGLDQLVDVLRGDQ